MTCRLPGCVRVAVSDDDLRAWERADRFGDLRFRGGIEGGGRLVEDEDRCLFKEGSGDRDSLAFTA